MSANPRQVLANSTTQPTARRASVSRIVVSFALIGLATLVGCAHTQPQSVVGAAELGNAELGNDELGNAGSTDIAANAPVLGVVRFNDRDLIIHPGERFTLRLRNGDLLLESVTISALRDTDPILATQIERMRATNMSGELDASVDVDLLVLP